MQMLSITITADKILEAGRLEIKIVTIVAVAAVCQPSSLIAPSSLGIHQEWLQVTGKLLAHSIPSLFWQDYF